MNKQEAIDLLGGTVTAAARAIGISPSAVTQWPEELPARVVDRVHAALWRRSQQAQAANDAPASPSNQAAAG